MISVIVPALNEERHIADTLRAAQALRGDKEIIVVDGGSEDATVARAEAFGVPVLVSPRGRGIQQHRGASVARGDVLWFLHSDTLAPPEALSSIEAALAAPDVTGGCFSLRFDGTSVTASQLNAVYPWLGLLGLIYGDAGIFVRRSAYEAVGGFRPFALFEDVDLVRRLRSRGRFVRLECRITTSSRRFERRSSAGMWAQWVGLQLLYWGGVHPDRLARWYAHVRR